MEDREIKFQFQQKQCMQLKFLDFLGFVKGRYYNNEGIGTVLV